MQRLDVLRMSLGQWVGLMSCRRCGLQVPLSMLAQSSENCGAGTCVMLRLLRLITAMQCTRTAGVRLRCVLIARRGAWLGRCSLVALL